MERKLDRDRRLADYIYNDLSSEEVVEMEREISGDPELSESYLLHTQVKEYLQTKLQLEEMRSDPQLEEAEKLAAMAFETESHSEMDPVSIPGDRQRKRVRNLIVVSAIAAGLAILITFGILPSGMNPDRLYDRYYAPLAATDYSQRGDAKEIYRDIARGINHYLDGNYSQSIEQFGMLASDPAVRTEVQFYTALSNLGLGQYQPAQSLLESVVNADSKYQAEALWYLSLLYLKTGNFNQADSLLAKLELYDGLYQKDAQALRKKLRRLSP